MEKSVLAKRVKLRKKGQITIPKEMRESQGLKEEDTFIVSQMAEGGFIVRKYTKKNGVDLMLEAIRRAPKFDWRKAWEEVETEREKERS